MTYIYNISIIQYLFINIKYNSIKNKRSYKSYRKKEYNL